MASKMSWLSDMNRTLITLPVFIAIATPMIPQAVAAEGMADEGKKIAFSRKKGNCLACHLMADGQMPGNIAPPLIGMKGRYPDKAKLRAQIWDATVTNPDSPMPPFGKHNILSDKELDEVVEYVWTL